MENKKMVNGVEIFTLSLISMAVIYLSYIHFSLTLLQFNSTCLYLYLFFQFIVNSMFFWITHPLNNSHKSLGRCFRLMLINCTMILLSQVVIYMLTLGEIDRIIIFASIINVIVLTVLRYGFIKLKNLVQKEKNVLLIGHNIEDARDMILNISDFKENENIRTFILYSSKDKEEYIKNHDKVYLSEHVVHEDREDVLNICIKFNKQLVISGNVLEFYQTNANYQLINDCMYLNIWGFKPPKISVVIKRLFDVVASLIGLVIFTPIILIVGFVTLITEGRPIFYKQTRYTKNRHEFELIKFRTMILDAESETGPIWARKNDERFTKIGHFMKRFWLDELPQLWNVLKGDISLIGPRPERPVLHDQFVEDIPEFEYRLCVKGGITGVAQVFGEYNTSPANKLKMDLIYISKYSIFYDLYIVFETFRKIIKAIFSLPVKKLSQEDVTDLINTHLDQKENIIRL